LEEFTLVFNPIGSGLALVWDFVAMVVSIIAVMMVVRINAAIRHREALSSDVTRKLVHIFAAPVFSITWFLYAGTYLSRFIAAVVPILFVLLFLGIGTGKVKNDDFVKSMSRSGDPRELLHGTLYYSVMIVIITIGWFYAPVFNPLAFIMFGCLAGGDGIADIVGRKFGGERKFGIGGAQKTVAGSMGMFIGSLLFSTILVALYAIEAGFDVVALFTPILIICVVATFVEVLTPKNLDNWTVPISVVVVAYFLSVFAPAMWPYALWTL